MQEVVYIFVKCSFFRDYVLYVEGECIVWGCACEDIAMPNCGVDACQGIACGVCKGCLLGVYAWNVCWVRR